MKLPVIRSPQGHGASVDKEKDLVKRVKAGKYKRVVIVEMPGVRTEEALRKAGIEVVIIDHHEYTDLDRARNPKTGRMLASSIEQFRKLFRLTDPKIKELGFTPRMIKAIGVMDRGYVWALLKEGFTKSDVREIFEYQDRLMDAVRDPSKEAAKMTEAQKVWEVREVWKEFFIVRGKGPSSLRVRLSRIVALTIQKPTPLIIVEKDRGFIYVQESPKAKRLFKRFGGFTFGFGLCWGYKNEKGKPKVKLVDVQAVLAE